MSGSALCNTVITHMLPNREPAPNAPPLTLPAFTLLGVCALVWDVDSGERERDCCEEWALALTLTLPCCPTDCLGGVEMGIEEPRAALER